MPKLFSRLPSAKQGLIGHRGAAGLTPENTLDSFKKAAELGLNWIEFDVQCCQGNEWVVFHDKILDRTTNGSGLVANTPLAKILELDAGSWFDPKFNTARVPLLKEALQTAKALNLHPNIEIKTFPEVPFDKQTKMRNLLEQLAAFWPEQLPPPLLSSFDLEILDVLRSLSTSIPLGYNIYHNVEASILMAKEHQFDSLHIPTSISTPTFFKFAKKHELPLLVFTVNEPSQIQDLLNQGATAVFSDLTNFNLADH